MKTQQVCSNANKRRSITFIITALFFAVDAIFATTDYIHYHLGVKYKNEGKLDMAIEEFRRVLAVYPDNYNSYMHIAEICKKQNNPRLVIYNAKKALLYNPGWGKAHKLLAEAYEMDGQYQKAIMELQLYQQSCDPAERDSVQMLINSLLNKIKGIDPPKVSRASTSKQQNVSAVSRKTNVDIKENPVARQHFEKGVESYKQQRYDEALEHFRKAISIQPGHPGSYYYAGLIRYRQGNKDMAKFNFEKALAYPELGYNANFYLGKICAQEKKYNEAIAYMQEYVKKTSYEEGKQEAIRLIEEWRIYADSLNKERDVLDPAFFNKKDSVVQEVSYSPIEIRLDSLLTMQIVDTLTDPGQLMLKGVNAFKDNQFDKAISFFRELLVKYPRGEVAAKAMYNIGICYFKLRLFTQAENQFQQVLQRFPTDIVLGAQSQFFKALCAFEKRNLTVAEKQLQMFIQNRRDHEWLGKAYEKLGDVYMDMEKHSNAIDAYRIGADHAINISDKTYSLFKLAMAYFKVDNISRAINALKQVIEEGEKHRVYERVPDSYYKIADQFYRQKEYKKALDYYLVVTRKYPSFQETPWGLFQVATIYRSQGDYKRAIETFKLLTQKYPDDYWARQAKWKMEDTIWEYEYKSALN